MKHTWHKLRVSTITKLEEIVQHQANNYNQCELTIRDLNDFFINVLIHDYGVLI